MNEKALSKQYKVRQGRTEPLRADSIMLTQDPDLVTLEITKKHESFVRSKKGKVALLAGKAAMAAACTIPIADLALSDAWTAKQYEVVTERVTMDSPLKEAATENGILAALGIAETVALGQVISRNKKVQNAFNDFEDYAEERHARMGTFKRGVSKTVNAPFAALEKVANGFNAAGERLSRNKAGSVRTIGKLAVEAGQVNVMGTSGMILQETMAGNPPKIGRQVYLGGLIMASWLGAAEGIRQVYRNVPLVRPPLDIVGRTYEAMTSMDVTDPLSTPLSTTVITSTVAALAYTGWKIEEFRERKEQMTAIDSQQL